MSYPTFAKRSRVPVPAPIRADMITLFGAFAGQAVADTPVYAANLKRYQDAYAALDTGEDTHIVVKSVYHAGAAHLIHELCHVFHWYSFQIATLNAAHRHAERMEVAVFFCMHRLCAMAHRPYVRQYLEDLDTPDGHQRENVSFGRLAQFMYPYADVNYVVRKILTGDLELR